MNPHASSCTAVVNVACRRRSARGTVGFCADGDVGDCGCGCACGWEEREWSDCLTDGWRGFSGVIQLE